MVKLLGQSALHAGKHGVGVLGRSAEPSFEEGMQVDHLSQCGLGEGVVEAHEGQALLRL